MNLIERRRQMMMSKSNGYIQEGLIFHLDGLDKGNDIDAWTDLVSNVYFPYVSGVSSLSKGVNFASGHSMFKAVGNINWNFNDCTLEMCVSNINNMLIFDSTINKIALGVYGNLLLFGNKNSSIYSKSYTYTNKKSSLSIQFGVGYQDGVDITRENNTFWSGGGSGITLGSRGTQAIYTGIIYDVRVYNRHLSEDEVLHNYQIDYNRYLIE